MKTIQDKIGNTEVLIQAIDENTVIVGQTRDRPSIVLTGIEDAAVPAYAKVKAAIRAFAEDISADLESLHATSRLEEVELEYNLAISAQAGPVLFSAKGEYGLKVRMTWRWPDNA